MIIDEEVYLSHVAYTGEVYYLEHFGKKGMKWGVRNQKLRSSVSKGKVSTKRVVSKGIVGGKKVLADPIVRRTLVTGAAVTAAMLAGPIAAMAVNSLGTIVTSQPAGSAKVKHSDKVYLEHFGTKGMQWGVRKSRVKSAAQRAWASPVTRRTIKIGGLFVVGTLALWGANHALNLASHHEPGPMVYGPHSMQGQTETTAHYLKRFGQDGINDWKANPHSDAFGPGHVVNKADLIKGERFIKDHSEQFKGGWVGPPPDTSDVHSRAYIASETAGRNKILEEHNQWMKDVVTGVYKRGR